jgi:hypothetical protein
MRTKIETPTDPMTGIPLPIFPNSELPPPLSWNEHNTERIGDEHHPFHPRRQLLGMDLAGEALRHCRVQWTMYGDHHEESARGYHHFYEGPPLPDTDEAWYRTVVFASAGFVPYKALTVDREGAPVRRILSREAHDRLLDEGIIRVGKYGKVKDYLLDYAVKRGRKEIDEQLISNFLGTKDLEKKLALGQKLIRVASEVVTEPLSPIYREAKKAKLLPYRRSGEVGNYVCNLLTIKTDRSGKPDTAMIDTLDKLLSVA